MKKHEKLIILIATALLFWLLFSNLFGCVSNRDVVNNYHRGGVKPTGCSESKKK